jgi:hypothetical protein
VVERVNGVAQQWADPADCTSRRQLQARLNHECEVQRERYPSVAGRPRSEAYPGLRHSGRPYRPGDERRAWDLAHVDRFLSGLTLYRRADARGAIWLYNEGRGLGRAHRGKEVRVRFDAPGRRWVVTDLQGEELGRLPAEELGRERIMALDVGRKRDRRRGPGSRG